jgi:chemotaxis protein methyltransferase CheR
MDDQVFAAFRDLIYRESGISLRQDKKQLLSARIQRRLRELQLGNAGQYLDIIESDSSGYELVELLDSISTNVTYFFREPEHFRFLREQLAEWKSENRPQLKIWCAASSSGQEPYTIAMCVHEIFGSASSSVKILATDLCTKVLARAVDASYSTQEVEHVPKDLLRRYFRVHGEQNNNFAVTDELKKLIAFRKLNLIHHPYPMKGPLDLIFCRNVMIYFDHQVRSRIVEEFTRLIPVGGYLVLSHSESLMGIDAPFKRIGSSVYVRTT